MAPVEFPAFEYHPRMPNLDQIDPRRLLFLYEPVSDVLTIYFDGEPRPAINVPSGDEDDLVSFRVDPATEEVVGVEVEDLFAAGDEHPRWVDLAQLAGITEQKLESPPPQIVSELRAYAAVARLRDLIPALE